MLSTPAPSRTRPTLEITRQVMGRTIVLTLSGSADANCIDDLEDQLAQAAILRPQHAVIDLSRLGDVDDLVSATLSGFANSVRHAGGSVRYVMKPMRRSA